ncbi:hypothetical protein OAU44_00175 [bacterium]|nr:hypothetical protein [bacterium]
MTDTDDRYEKILKSFEADTEFDVPKVDKKREASTEDWMDDGITLKELMKARTEDEAGVVAKPYGADSLAIEDHDIISMNDLLKLQKEEQNIIAKKFNGSNGSREAHDLFSDPNDQSSDFQWHKADSSDLLKTNQPIRNPDGSISDYNWDGTRYDLQDQVGRADYRSDYPSPESLATEGEFKCPKCSFSTNDDDAWSYHMQDHDEGSALVSDFMKYEMESKASEGIEDRWDGMNRNEKETMADVNEWWGNIYENILSKSSAVLNDDEKQELERAFNRYDSDRADGLYESKASEYEPEEPQLQDQSYGSKYMYDEIEKLKKIEKLLEPEFSYMGDDYAYDSHKANGESEDKIEKTDVDDTDKVYDELKESYEESTMENQNQGFKSDSDEYGVADLNADREGKNMSKDFWSKTITTDDEATVLTEYNPQPNAKMGDYNVEVERELGAKDFPDSVTEVKKNDRFLASEEFGDSWSFLEQQMGNGFSVDTLASMVQNKFNLSREDAYDEVYNFEGARGGIESKASEVDINNIFDTWAWDGSHDGSEASWLSYAEKNGIDYSEAYSKWEKHLMGESKASEKFRGSQAELDQIHADNWTCPDCGNPKTNNEEDLWVHYREDHDYEPEKAERAVSFHRQRLGLESKASESMEDEAMAWYNSLDEYDQDDVIHGDGTSDLKSDRENILAMYSWKNVQNQVPDLGNDINHYEDQFMYHESKATEDDFNHEFDELSSLAQQKIEDTDVTPTQWDETPIPQREQLEDAIADAPVKKLDEQYDSMGDVWQCPECGFKTGFEDEFNDHEKSHVKAFDEDEISRPYDNLLDSFRS